MGSEWPTVRLGVHCRKIGSGATPRGGKTAYLERGDFALIRSQNVYNDGFRLDGLAFISPDQAAALDGVSVEAGDVLVNITGDSVARVCQAPSYVIPARVNQHVAIVRPRPNEFDPRFIRYFLAVPAQQELLLSLASVGATRPALTKGMLEQLEIPKPPLSVQRDAVEPLWAIDQRIANLRRTNATLEAIAQALFKSWFVDFDPVRAKTEGREPEGMDALTAALFPNEFEDSAIGPIPAGWRIERLGKVSQNIREQANPAGLDPETPYIGLEHMPRRSIALMEQGVAEGLASGKFWYRKNDILFGKLRPYFHKVGVATASGVCSTDILVVRPASFRWFGYVAMQFSSDALVSHATRLSNGAKMPRTNWSDLASYRVALPGESVAAAFDDMVRSLLEKLHANIASASTLASLRDTLLPRLISGKLRLPDAEREIEATA